MAYQHKTEGCFSPCVGDHGLNPSALEDLNPEAMEALSKFKAFYEKGEVPHFTLPFLRKDLVEASSLVTRFQDEFSDIIVLGTGGSSLGGQALVSLGTHRHPKFHFVDNIDPYTFSQLMNSLKVKSTGVIAISKSGSTAETMVQLITCLQHWRSLLSEASWSTHFLVITEKKSSPLFRLKEKYNLSFLEHDPKLGGRFSIFSLVALFPALVAQVDPLGFRDGAASIIQKMSVCSDPLTFEPAIGAIIGYKLSKEKGKTLSVMMPYSDRLAIFSKWYRQLWAESLGKEGFGTTPIDALGAVDQHSQLQLYLDGPRDKFFTIITTDCRNQGPDVLPPSFLEDIDLQYLYQKRLGDLMQAEQEATVQTLLKNQCPTRVIHVPEVSPYSLGALCMHFVFETLFTAEFLGVDPFNQPAVEEGKILAKQFLLNQSQITL